MAASTWKGFITFGLISVPIRLFPAARYSHIRFHEVHKKCGHRVQQQLYCPYDEEVVPRDEIVMGYETEDGKMIIVDPQELKAILPQSSTEMEILQFAELDEVDPIYFETSYFAVPEEAGRRAYALILGTMQQMKIAAIARVTMHQRDRTVIIRPYDQGLAVHTMYYPADIHEAPGYGKDTRNNQNRQELSLAEQFAKSLVRPFHPEKFHDGYQARLRELIEDKRKGKDVPRVEKGKKLAPVIDLMAALKQSLAKGKSATGKSPKASRPVRQRKSA
ncbi:MAG TPA: Ku protein [Candidatus Acidoferrales bacterium]